MSPLSWIRRRAARTSRTAPRAPARRLALEDLEDRCLLSVCQPGYWSPTGEEPGAPASPGYYVPTAGATFQTPAPLGSYVDTFAASIPTQALPGSYVDTFGASSPKLAQPGYYVPTAGATQPTPAFPGYYVPTPGATREIRDPRGTCSGVAAATYSRINPAPIVDGLGAQVGDEGDSVRLPVLAIDVPEDRLQYRASGLPAGLAINSSTGLIYGILGSHAARATPYSVTVSVSDGHKSSRQSFTWAVHEMTTPVLVTPGSQTSAEGDFVKLALHAVDADHDPLTYSATGLPRGLKINARTGVISGRLGTHSGGDYTVTVTASDAIRSASSTFAWTVLDLSPPSVQPLTNQASRKGDAVSLLVFATDADRDALTFTATGLPPGLSIDPASGLISGTVGSQAAQASTFHVTVTASDGQRSGSAAFDWAVADNPAPSLTPPADQ